MCVDGSQWQVRGYPKEGMFLAFSLEHAGYAIRSEGFLWMEEE